MEIDLDVGINEIADRGQESSPCCHSGKLCWVTEHFIFVVEQQQATVEGLGNGDQGRNGLKVRAPRRFQFCIINNPYSINKRNILSQRKLSFIKSWIIMFLGSFFASLESLVAPLQVQELVWGRLHFSLCGIKKNLKNFWTVTLRGMIFASQM